jgi:hypothetical protein
MIAVEVIADFEDPAKTLEGLRVTWMIPKLRFKKGLPDLAANGCRKRLQVFPAVEPTKIVGLSESSRSFTEL